MSITPFVHHHPCLRAPSALLVALVVGIAPAALATDAAGATAPPRVARPARAGNADPAARIAGLSALVATREATTAAAQGRLDATRRDLARARLAEAMALSRADALNRAAEAAEQRYEAARERAGEVAAAVYRNTGNAHTLTRLLDSGSPAEYGYRQKIAHAVGEVQMDIVRRAVATRRAAAKLAEEADRQKLRYRNLVLDLQAQVPNRTRDAERARAALANARFWLTRWQSISAGVNTPIMGRSILSPSEMAAWFEGTHRRARITVPIAELARDYIEEGAAAGVRGDIAWAQSILETGSFYFPDGGQLTPQDNNFAGMDACDSCARGRAFPDARTGVRAQLQQLRVYADPTVTNASLDPPPVVANLDQHHLKGRVPTWNGLTHTWATADTYGDRILQIYAQMLAWVTDHADF
jgi:hypothetical protein